MDLFRFAPVAFPHRTFLFSGGELLDAERVREQPDSGNACDIGP